MMHTKSGEGQAFTVEKKEGRKEGRRWRGRTDKKAKITPGKKRRKQRENKRREKRERENENVGSTVFCSRATLKMYFFASRPIYPEDKGHRVSHTDVHTLNRVNELIITPRLPELVVK